MRLAVIADELTAAGWRLAGARVHTPEMSAVSACLQAVSQEADLVLITAALACAVPAGQLEEALLTLQPLLLVMADVRHEREPPDLESLVRRAFGVGA
jgi:vacuolar-type H+-ATPase subunit F/Vma7